MTELQSCEQKYFYRKVASTPVDTDYVESDALGLGKAFHCVLEKSKHLTATTESILEAMDEFKVDISEKDLLTVMLNKYIEFRKLSEVKVIKCELPLGTSSYNGFIDFIGIRGNEWFIGDLKTAARHDENILSRLPLDPQLNLYSYFAGDLDSHILELEGKRFAGCLYTQITKSKAGTMKGLEAGVKVYETFVPIEVMNPTLVFNLFNEVHDRALELHAGQAPRKNLSACFNFFSACQYFSKCHGCNFSDNKKKVILTTSDSLKDTNLL